jgi:hypothetical protein
MTMKGDELTVEFRNLLNKAAVRQGLTQASFVVERPLARPRRPPAPIRLPRDPASRIRQETGLLVLFGVRRQGYSTYEMRADGLPIWGMPGKSQWQATL